MRNTTQICPRDKIAFRFYDHVLGLSFCLIGFSDGLTISLMELFPDTWLDHKRSQNVEHTDLVLTCPFVQLPGYFHAGAFQ